jgi:hypothetical protein
MIIPWHFNSGVSSAVVNLSARSKKIVVSQSPLRTSLQPASLETRTLNVDVTQGLPSQQHINVIVDEPAPIPPPTGIDASSSQPPESAEISTAREIQRAALTNQWSLSGELRAAREATRWTKWGHRRSTSSSGTIARSGWTPFWVCFCLGGAFPAFLRVEGMLHSVLKHCVPFGVCFTATTRIFHQSLHRDTRGCHTLERSPTDRLRLHAWVGKAKCS